MSANGIAQIVFYLVVLTALTPPLGAYMARVFEGRRVPGLTRVLGPVERGTFRLLRIDPEREQAWKAYATAVLAFSVASFAVLYAILRLQGHLPLNPNDYPGMSWNVAFNTAASFITNTNWQYYGGESTLSYLSQTVGLTVQNFVSAAVGHGRPGGRHPRLRAARDRGAGQLLGRPGAHHALHPAAARDRRDADPGLPGRHPDVLRPGQLPDPRGAHARRHRRRPAQPATQSIYRGAVASQVAIKQLGTNGGGYYNANSAVPLENPTGADELRRGPADPADPGRPDLHLRRHGRLARPGLGAVRHHDGRSRRRPRRGPALRAAGLPGAQADRRRAVGHGRLERAAT